MAAQDELPEDPAELGKLLAQEMARGAEDDLALVNELRAAYAAAKAVQTGATVTVEDGGTVVLTKGQPVEG